MKSKTIRFVFLSLVCAGILPALAQTYPSSLSTILINNRTLFLDEYADHLKPKIKVVIRFTDFSEPSWQFALRMRITGPGGIVIQTRPGVRPLNAAMVSPGQPYEMQGADLAFYFNYDNLSFTGITRTQLEVNHRLPEGLYSFCFEAVDYESGKALSHPGCASAYLSLNDPPLILYPANGSVVENISMQNILLQWQRGNATANPDPGQLSYQVNLYEVNNSWTNPVTAIMNNQALPVWQSALIPQTSYLYTNIDPPLERGKRYVFTVRAIESNGRSSFKNNGYSQPRWFRYGYQENDTIDLVKPGENFQFALSTPSEFRWKKPRKAQAGQLVSYTLKLVELGANQDPESAVISNLPFFQQTYIANTNALLDKTIPVTIWGNVKRMGNYAWQVTAQSGMQQIAKSRAQTFVGPPDIETFIAGGFLMKVTRLTYYDKTNHIISGRCKTLLNNSWNGQETEFAFNKIRISSIGNNEWVMISGSISDRISTPAYSLQPQTVAGNKHALFTPDSIYVNTSGLKLAGIVEWTFPHAGPSMQLEKITTARCRLSLANSSFHLNNSNPVTLAGEQQLPLMEPYGFTMILQKNSSVLIYQSKYEFSFNGHVQLPSVVATELNTPAKIAFSNARQLMYISETANSGSESIRLAQNAMLLFTPATYVIDLSEKQSPAEFVSDSSWKGIHITKAKLSIPKDAEQSGQLKMASGKSFDFTNTTADTNTAFVTSSGFHLRSYTPFQLADSVKFNGFPSKSGFFYARIEESSIVKAYLRGGILIPVVDTLNAFPYEMELSDFGFSEGYLVNGLANKSFTFNAAGSAEQRIAITIRRAVFKGRNRIEMDLDLSWPYFSLTLPGVQRFCAWGNGNIGFDVPNGKSALSYQASGKAGNFTILADHLGCGRSGNAYAIGASAKISMDEEISGETGPPVVNAYSIYKNPLLTGMVVIPATTSTTSAGGSTTTSAAYQSSTAGYTAAVAGGIGDALNALGAGAAATGDYSLSAESTPEPLLSGNVVAQISALIEMLYKLKPFIPDGYISEKDWAVVDRFKSALASDIISRTQTANARATLNFVLQKVVEGMVYKLAQPMENISDKAITKVRQAVQTAIVSPVNNKIESSLGNIFSAMQKKVLAQVGDEHHAAVVTTFSVVKNAVATNIKNAVAVSFEKNVTSKVTGFVKVGVTAKITGYVRSEVASAGRKLITDGVHAKIGLHDMLKNANTAFASVADTVRHVIMQLNGDNFVNTAESMVNDAIAGIDWNVIANQIKNDLIARGISSAVSSQLSQVFGDGAGQYAGALLNSVKFDFSNLGEKLQNGQFDKIVKFDPTNIFIQSPVADIRGTVKYTRNDPVYGDNWQAYVFVKVKVPKKDNAVECSGFFLNGKTTQLTENFTFWYLKLDVHGLAIPLSPAPVVWDGAEGFAFSKMKKTGSTVLPDAGNKFGVGCRFYFYDQQSSGKTYLFDLGADATFDNAGFAIELSGNASVMNYQKTNGKYKSPGFVTGTGQLGYYKVSGVSKVCGNFNVQLNTQPVLCAGGDVGLDLKTPNDWKVWVGTQQNPIAVKVLCKDFLSNTAYLQVGNTGFQAGLGMNVNIEAKSPWVQMTGIKVRGFATLQFGYNAYTSIEWDPTFKINEASISAWLSAAVGVDYETATTTSSLTVAGVSLSGTLSYKSNPQSEIHGQLNGSITLVGYNVGLELPVHYSLSEQKILN